MIAAATVGTVIVVAAFGLVGPLSTTAACGSDDVLCQGRAAAIGFCAFGLPGLVLVAATGRLSARLCDSQVAALRVLGAARRQLAVVVATRAVSVVLAGAGLAVLPVLVGRRLVRDSGGAVAEFARGLGTGELCSAVGVVVAMGLVSAAIGAFPSARAPRRRRPRDHARRRVILRAVPLACGLALVLAGCLMPVPENGSGSAKHAVGVAGAIITLVGLPVGFPVLLRLCGRWIANVSGGPVRMLAGRSLEWSAERDANLVAALLTTLAFAVVLQGEWNDIAAGGEIARALRAESTGPNVVTLDGPGEEVRVVADDPAVRRVFPFWVGDCADGSCHGVLVASCRDYASAVAPEEPFECPDSADRAVLTRNVPNLAGKTLEPGLYTEDAKSLTVPEGNRPALLVDGIPFPGGWEFLALLPAEWFGEQDVLTGRWLAVLSPGNANVVALQEKYDRLRVDPMTGGPEVYQQALSYRLVIYALFGSAILAAMSGLLLSMIDRMSEKRDLIGHLTSLGFPAKVIARSFAWEIGVPLVVGIPVACGIGALVMWAVVYRPDPGITQPPWAIAGVTGGLAMIVSAAIVGLTLAASRVGAERIGMGAAR
jgi:hypothetical protein